MGDLSTNFSAWEFACPCGCGQSKMQQSTISRLQALRTEYGKPMQIVEGGGYRCVNYESSEHSAHREGRAVDPSYPREDHFTLLSLAIKHGFTGIGDKQKDGRWQLHIDDSTNIPGIRPRPVKWTY